MRERSSYILVTVLLYDKSGALLGGSTTTHRTIADLGAFQPEVTMLSARTAAGWRSRAVARTEIYATFTNRSAPELTQHISVLDDHPEWKGENVLPSSGRVPNRHVMGTAKVEYTTNPPAWGPHIGCSHPSAKYYVTAPTDPWLVRFLELGGIVISYDPERVSPSEVQELIDLWADLNQKGSGATLTPRAGMDTPLAVTAWGYLLKLETLDLEAVRGFYQIHSNNTGHQCR